MRIALLFPLLLGCSSAPADPDAGDTDAGPDVVYACPAHDAGGNCRGPDGGFLCTDPNKPWCIDGTCSRSYGWCASTPTYLQPCTEGEASCPTGMCAVGTPCTMREGFQGTCQCTP